MKARVWDSIRLLEDVPGEVSGREVIPAGTTGVVIEAYESPVEGYAVDVAIPDDRWVGGYDYDNLILYPQQFTVTKRHVDDEPVAPTAARR